jgi:hypothetical protein
MSSNPSRGNTKSPSVSPLAGRKKDPQRIPSNNNHRLLISRNLNLLLLDRRTSPCAQFSMTTLRDVLLIQQPTPLAPDTEPPLLV